MWLAATVNVQAQNLFVTQLSDNSVYEIASNGVQTVFASGLNGPIGLTFDHLGNLFASDFYSGNIYKFTPSGSRSTFTSGINEPTGLAFNGAGNLFVANQGNGYINEITPGGFVGFFASGFTALIGLTLDGAGNVYVSDGFTKSVYVITQSGEGTFTSGVSGEGIAFRPAPVLQAARINGTFQLTVSTLSPYYYETYSTIIQTSTNLVNWVNTYTNTPPFTYTEAMTPATAHFYRALLGP